MAEAHQAVAFQFSITDEGILLHFDKTAVKSALLSFFGSYRKRILKVRTAIYRGIFPASPVSLAVIVALVVALWSAGYDPTCGVLPRVRAVSQWIGYGGYYLTLPFLAFYSLFIWTVLSYLQRFLLKALLHYKGFMFEPRGKPSLVTIIWFKLVHILTATVKPQLYSYQRSLPRLPVPRLEDTCKRYLLSVKALLNDEEYKEMEQLIKDFQDGPGKKMNRYLYLKAWWANNYVTDWWEQYVYLWGRSSIMINSNYYACDNTGNLTTLPAARAGALCYYLSQMKNQIETERLPPLVGSGVPLCSAQYERLFGTTRIPGVEADKLLHTTGQASNHIAVYYRGRWYKIKLYHKNRFLNPAELEWTMQEILNDPNTEVGPGEMHLAALTAADRKFWAETREDFFMEGVNRTSMDIIEKASFFLVFDDMEPSLVVNDGDNTDLCEYCQSLMHGNGYTRWFDKSFTAVVYKNGKIGVNGEHSWADAPIIGHMLEFSCNMEHTNGYRSGGHAKGDVVYTVKPQRLQWNIPPEAVSRIDSSLATIQESISNLDLHVLHHDMFGKGDIKKIGISPDGFIQMAIQLAYYKDSGGSFCLTYEASMTRLYLEGRTETVRPVTVESSTFVKAMCNPQSNDEERRQLLRKAVDRHAHLYKLAMTGKGVDRHLFCLYVLSKYLKIESPFLAKVLGEPWRLSTSQTPAQQTGKLDYDNIPALVSPGGGFGPVTEKGYGVSYIIQGDYHIYFHVSSFKSAENTDSKRFVTLIKNSMKELRDLFLDKL